MNFASDVTEATNSNVSNDISELPATGKYSTKSTSLPYPTDFQTVMDYINKGLEIPGLENITIEATNDAMPNSSIIKPKKPWE